MRFPNFGIWSLKSEDCSVAYEIWGLEPEVLKLKCEIYVIPPLPLQNHCFSNLGDETRGHGRHDRCSLLSLESEVLSLQSESLATGVWSLEFEAWNLKYGIWSASGFERCCRSLVRSVDPVEPNSIQSNLISLLGRILVTWFHDRLILSRLLHLMLRSNPTRSVGRPDSFWGEFVRTLYIFKLPIHRHRADVYSYKAKHPTYPTKESM